MMTDSTDDALASEGNLPYWQVNVPPAEREAVCPAFLRDASAKDRCILATPQTAYRVLNWADVRALVGANDLAAFQRDPLTLRRYLHFLWQLRQRYGSVAAYILRERLGWAAPDTATEARLQAPLDIPLGDPAATWPRHVRVLCNDWPYGIDPRIIHLVVWTPFALPDDPVTDDLALATRTAIQRYVDATFGVLPPDRYTWFKNTRVLRSVLHVEHFHVMLFDPPGDLVAHITHGDVPLSERLARGESLF